MANFDFTVDESIGKTIGPANGYLVNLREHKRAPTIRRNGAQLSSNG